MSDETEMEPERRRRSSAPPTIVLRAYQGLDPKVRLAVQVLGFFFAALGGTLLVVVEIFKEMPWIYGVYCAGLGVVGIVLMVPPLGLWLLERIPATLAPFLRPDRRGGDS